MSLPKWVSRVPCIDGCPECEFTDKVIEALSIAVEALTEITNERCDKYHGDQAADALRRIEEMGK